MRACAQEEDEDDDEEDFGEEEEEEGECTAFMEAWVQACQSILSPNHSACGCADERADTQGQKRKRDVEDDSEDDEDDEDN